MGRQRQMAGNANLDKRYHGQDADWSHMLVGGKRHMVDKDTYT